MDRSAPRTARGTAMASQPIRRGDQDKATGMHTRQALLQTATYYVSFIALGLAYAVWGPTLSGLAENTGTVVSQLGILFTVKSLGGLVGALLGSRLYDRASGHPVASIMLLVMAGMLVVAPASSTVWLLCLFVFVFGFSGSTLDIGANTMILWVHGRAVPPFMNALHFAFGVGASLSPLLVAQALVWTRDITWAYWAIAVLVVPVAVWILRVPSPLRRALSSAEPGQQADPVLVGLIMGFFFLYVGAEMAFYGWIFTFAVRSAGVSEPTAAYMTSAFWGAFTLGRLLGVPVAARARPRTILFGSITGAFLGLGLLAIWPSSVPAIWIGSVVVGLSLACIFPTILSLAERRMVVTGKISGLFFTGASLGGMTVPWLIGRLMALTGPQAMMWCLLADLGLALAVLLVLVSHSARERPPRLQAPDGP